MCKMCTIRAMGGLTEGDYSRGFEFERGGAMGDPFLAALAPLAMKAVGGIMSKLSKKGGRAQVGGAVLTTAGQMTGITPMVKGISAIKRIAGGQPAPPLETFRAPGLGQTIAGGRFTAAGRAAGHRARGRGISSRELRGFRKVTNLLRRVGMVPRGLGHTRGRRRR